ncbi:hypothetical protein D9613_005496 [Agrocybe pediades]|uniref:Uncharacterized protein n=1 Tax=Agrocybe pediades TaxID=84607 RepID=A0A8H4VS30_9AGAR|nr:hypothetical protein D9613_005496 [Agrocybe pediades]
MSTISFPNPYRVDEDDHHHNPHADIELKDQFYQPSYDTSAFQINPLSSRPPRTPRTSLHVNSSNHYSASSSVYRSTTTEDGEEEVEVEVTVEKTTVDVEEIEVDLEEDRVKSLEKRIKQEDVWREMFLTSNGRDKAFKLIQYSIRVLLIFHSSLVNTRLLRRAVRPLWEQNIVKRLQSTASGFSFTRKLLLLFNWLHPLSQILAQQSVPFSAEVSSEKVAKQKKPFLQTLLYAPPPVLLELANAVADDIATWARLGLLGKRIGSSAERFSDWCWFLATLVGLVENGVERQMIGGLQAEIESRLYAESMSGATAKSKPKATKIDEKELTRLRNQDYWLQVTRAKLAMDLIFRTTYST